MRSMRWFGGLSVAAVLTLVSCTKSATTPSTPEVLSLSVVSGDQQSGVAGAELAAPLVVKVTKANGAPVNGQVVNFRVVSGGGSVFAGTAITDSRGIAQERWTLGSTESQRVEARAVDNATGAPQVFATFNATIGPPPPPAACDCWSTKAPMTTPRAGLSAVGLNGKLYTLGGYNPGYSGELEEYDPATNTWTTKAQMLTYRYGVGVGVVGGIVYAVGGVVPSGITGEVEAYNPATNTWARLAPMPTVRHTMGVGVVNGILYAIGGFNSNVTTTGHLATVEAYNPATNTWTTKTPMPHARYGLGVAVVNGIIYAVGGDGPNGVVGTIEAYDPATDSWTTKTAMPVGRYVFGIGVLNGAIYIAAGSDEDYTTVADLVRYDPVIDSWSSRAPLPGGPRREHSAAAVGGLLYVVGGGPINGVYPTRVEAYQP